MGENTVNVMWLSVFGKKKKKWPMVSPPGDAQGLLATKPLRSLIRRRLTTAGLLVTALLLWSLNSWFGCTDSLLWCEVMLLGGGFSPLSVCGFILLPNAGSRAPGLQQSQHTDSWVVMRRLCCCAACGILLPPPRGEPESTASEGGFLITGPPGKSLIFEFSKYFQIQY